MSNLLRAELLKLRTTRTFIALGSSAVLLSLAAIVLTTLLVDEFDERDLREAFLTDFSSLFIALLGIIGITGEWRHRTITSSVLAAPDRIRLLAAKTIAYAVAGVVMSLVVTLTSFAVGSIILAARNIDSLGVADLADILWRNLLIAGLVGALGVGIGAVVRNQIAAVVGVLALSFAVEPLLIGLVPDVGRFGPTSGAPNAILDLQFGDEKQLQPGVAILVMLGWIATFLAMGGALLKRRDLT
jgi:ABC-2 type transport system permease protein